VDSNVGTVITVLLATILPLLGWVLARVNAIDSRCKDLHAWHAPDQRGRQTWKDIGPILERLDRLITLISAHIEKHDP
jgi:hypothetical protein